MDTRTVTRYRRRRNFVLITLGILLYLFILIPITWKWIPYDGTDSDMVTNILIMIMMHALGFLACFGLTLLGIYLYESIPEWCGDFKTWWDGY